MTSATKKTFDFDDFIKSVKPSECVVKVYAIDHRSEIEELQRQIDAEQSIEGASSRFGAKSTTATLAQRVKKLRDEMQKGALEFRFKPLHPDRIDHYVSPAEAARVEDGEDAVSAESALRDAKYEQLAEQAVYPPLDKEQWKQLAATLGAPRFADIVSRATDHTLRSVTLPPFSPSTLEALAPKRSDES